MKSEWISVAERLPDDGVEVLIGWAGCKSIDVASVHRKVWESHGVPYLEGALCDGVPPTHWMPAPEPPKMPDAFEEFCKDQPSINRNIARFVWDAAVKATRKPSDDRISKDAVKPLVDALRTVSDWDDNPGPPHTTEMLESVRKALARAKKLGLIE